MYLCTSCGECTYVDYDFYYLHRKEKQTIGISGGSPSDWDLYKDMETLLAPYKSYNPEGLVVDSVNRKYKNAFIIKFQKL